MIILGRMFGEHLTNLKVVFDWLNEPGLKLKPSKCALYQLEVEFYGDVSAKGVASDPAKTEKVANWPACTKVSDRGATD